jgi:hypothetical protein
MSPPRYFDMGDTVSYGSSNVGRSVDFEIAVKSANWVDVEYLRVWVNGEPLRDDDGEELLLRLPEGTDDDTVVPFSTSFDADAFVLVEAYGTKNLFPVLTPKEDLPANVGEAVQGLAGGLVSDLSFGSGDGNGSPSSVQKVQPYAFTNPIWIDVDGNGSFDPPGPKPVRPVAPDEDCPVSPLWSVPPEIVGKLYFGTRVGAQHYQRADVRRLFGTFGHH